MERSVSRDEIAREQARVRKKYEAIKVRQYYTMGCLIVWLACFGVVAPIVILSFKHRFGSGPLGPLVLVPVSAGISAIFTYLLARYYMRRARRVNFEE